MKRIIQLLCVLLLVCIPASCTSVSDNTQQNETEASSEGTEDPLEDTSSENKEAMEQTGYTVAVPPSYKTASDHPGILINLRFLLFLFSHVSTYLCLKINNGTLRIAPWHKKVNSYLRKIER